MNRLLFEKVGRAKFISHLDLMRTMQRIFIRAGVEIRHTEGFNPHPYMNFALPLPVGTESVCELMDFDLTGQGSLPGIPERLNAVSPQGIRVLECYEASRKFKEIKWLDISAVMFYDKEIPGADQVQALITGPELIMEKRTKRSSAVVDVRPLIHSAAVLPTEGGLALRARLAAGEQSLTPAQLISAIAGNAPAFAPDHVSFRRKALYDSDHVLFR